MNLIESTLPDLQPDLLTDGMRSLLQGHNKFPWRDGVNSQWLTKIPRNTIDEVCTAEIANYGAGEKLLKLRVGDILAILAYEPNGAKFEGRFGPDASSIVHWFYALNGMRREIEKEGLLSIKEEDMPGVLESLIKTGADLKMAQRTCPGLLFRLAMHAGTMNSAIKLLEAGFNPNVPVAGQIQSHADYGAHYVESAMFWAIMSIREPSNPLVVPGFRDLVRTGISKGWDINSFGTSGLTVYGALLLTRPGLYGRGKDKVDLRLRVLLEMGADPTICGRHPIIASSIDTAAHEFVISEYDKKYLNVALKEEGPQDVQASVVMPAVQHRRPGL